MNRLSIRFKPRTGESLSSYLLRSCYKNSVRINKLLREISKVPIEPRSPQFKPLIDAFPSRVISLEKLSEITEVTEQRLEQMTLSNVFKKMGSGMIDGRSIGGLIFLRSRRFCPVCLSEHKIYKLKWQIRDIEICDEHLVKLATVCRKCGKSQPYWNELTPLLMCRHCGSLLAGDGERVNEESIIVDQRIKHAQWDFMLKDDTVLIHDVPIIQNQALATKLLYVLQNYAPEFNRDDIQHIRKDRLYWLVRFIQGETEEHYLTIDLLLNSLRKTSLDIESFSQLTVPEEYKIGLLSDRAKSVQPGPCLAPWCASYGSNHDMKPIKHLGQVSKNYQAFRNPYVCTSCFVKYGCSRKGNLWSESGDLIKFGWHKIVPLLKERTSLLSISRECKVGIDKIRRIRGYFYGRGIVPGNEQVPPITDEILLKFKDAYSQKRSYRYAAKMYGWSPLVYWALYGSNVIQNYIVFQYRDDIGKISKRELTVHRLEIKIKKELETRLQNDLPITLAQVSSAVGCSAVLIQKYGLAPLIQKARIKRNEGRIERCHRLAEDYLGDEEDIYTDVSVGEFRKITGMGHWWQHQHVPEILRRIDEEQQRRIYQRRIRIVQASIEQLKEDHLPVSINAVIRVSGLDRVLIFRDPFLKGIIYNCNNGNACEEVSEKKSD